ncbi:hypothetical protein N658DRAFT_502080 [Parathielavia hyrcaniae]|uniref:Uncharacterized protein n=1 Tax=Parathielavia hyrcaniae TaxID=113614 RepID=A0AAN6PTX2_9PEZI|nr:hypothetical protein N658DRAFT_502080 [Parathielavia hyrcaniae]
MTRLIQQNAQAAVGANNNNNNQRKIPQVPKLTKAEDYPMWKDKVTRALNRFNLDRYILQDVPRPEDPEAGQAWLTDRSDVDDFLQGSVHDNKIWLNLKGMGWRSSANNPKDTFDKLSQYFEKGASDNLANLLIELANIRRSSFDKMESFTLRLNYLRERLESTEFQQRNTAYVWLALKGIQREYSDLYNRMVAGMDAGTVTWESLMAELRQIAVAETTQPAMTTVTVDKKKKDGKSADNNKDTSKDLANDGDNGNKRGERVDCTVCGKGITKGWKHCNGCGQHTKGGPCWWCKPEDAPDSWGKKSIAIEKKRQREADQTSTTALLHQQSGVANPSNVDNQRDIRKKTEPKPANLFFSTNMNSDDEDGYIAMTNISVPVGVSVADDHAPDFHSGPQCN